RRSSSSGRRASRRRSTSPSRTSTCGRASGYRRRPSLTGASSDRGSSARPADADRLKLAVRRDPDQGQLIVTESGVTAKPVSALLRVSFHFSLAVTWNVIVVEGAGDWLGTSTLPEPLVSFVNSTASTKLCVAH